MEALRWAMERMLQHWSCQSFGTDCKDLTEMVKEPQAWPSFSTELETINTLKINIKCFATLIVLFRFGFTCYLKFDLVVKINDLISLEFDLLYHRRKKR